MDILGGIAAATEGLNLVNELRKIDKEVDKAELKLRLVDVADKLLDSKQALQEAQEREFELRREVSQLTEKMKQRGTFEDENGLLYELNDDGGRTGEPFCNLCFVREDKQFRMRRIPANVISGEHYLCDQCQTKIILGQPKSIVVPSRGQRNWP